MAPPKGRNNSLPKNVHLGGSICTSITFSFVDQSSRFFFFRRGRDVVDQLLFHFRFMDPFRRYSRSKSKVVKNRAKFWTVFLHSQILGGKPSKNCTQVITPGSRHVVWKNDCEDTPTRPEVIDAHTLNFRPNF